MFICQPCHDKSQCVNGLIEGVFASRGACEVCNKTANCLDCHGYKNVPVTRCTSRHPDGQQYPNINSYRCRLNEGHDGPHKNQFRPDWYDADVEAALTEDSRIDPNPGGEDYPWPTDNPPLGMGNDYVTCGAFLSLHHPIRRATGTQECLCLIPTAELPKACPQCGQWKSWRSKTTSLSTVRRSSF